VARLRAQVELRSGRVLAPALSASSFFAFSSAAATTAAAAAMTAASAAAASSISFLALAAPSALAMMPSLV